MTHTIKTFKDACKKLGLDPVKSLPDVSTLPVKHQKAVIAMAALSIINEALNDGWTPDWSNSNEYKYYPWFDMVSGVGLSFCVFGRTRSGTTVGSRLVFKSRELAEYAGKQFAFVYQELMCL